MTHYIFYKCFAFSTKVYILQISSYQDIAFFYLRLNLSIKHAVPPSLSSMIYLMIPSLLSV